MNVMRDGVIKLLQVEVMFIWPWVKEKTARDCRFSSCFLYQTVVFLGQPYKTPKKHLQLSFAKKAGSFKSRNDAWQKKSRRLALPIVCTGHVELEVHSLTHALATMLFGSFKELKLQSLSPCGFYLVGFLLVLFPLQKKWRFLVVSILCS